ncbi:MAG: outer membrane beta-barrel protein [Verrucomicrobiota bacterium]
MRAISQACIKAGSRFENTSEVGVCFRSEKSMDCSEKRARASGNGCTRFGGLGVALAACRFEFDAGHPELEMVNEARIVSKTNRFFRLNNPFGSSAKIHGMQLLFFSVARRFSQAMRFSSGNCREISSPGLLLAAMVLAAPSTNALDASDVLLFSTGPLTVRPQVAVIERADDNIFFRDKEKDGDLITVVSPGVDLQLGRQESDYLLFQYRFDQVFFGDHDELNSSQHHFVDQSRIKWARVSLQGVDRIDFLSSVLGGSDRTFRENNVDRTTYYNNYIITYEISPKTQVYGEGHFDAVDYDEGITLFDQNNLMGTLGFGYQLFPKVATFGEGYYGQTANDPNLPREKPPHSQFYGGFIGARGAFTPRLSGTIKVGYEVREFSDNSPAPSAPAFDTTLTYAYSDKTSFALTYSRRTGVSTQFGREASIRDLLSLQVSQQIGVTGKFVGTAGVSYQLTDYERVGATINRNDKWFKGFASFNYRVYLWMTASLGYEYERFDTSLQSQGIIDYDVNRVTLRLAVGY